MKLRTYRGRLIWTIGAVAVALLLTAGVALGATELRKSVIGSGGGHASSASYVLDGTAGQPAPIGISTGATRQVQGGVWYGAGPALIACGSAADAADADADLLPNAGELTAGTDRCDDDTDGDRCDDGEELLLRDEEKGGQRDPLDFWDFYNVTADASIDIVDVVAILGKFGLAPGADGYDGLFDRYAPDSMARWRTAEAEGTNHENIDVEDVIVNLQSFGHSCADLP